MWFWATAWAGSLPVPVDNTGPVASLSAEQGSDQHRPWLSSSLGLGLDQGRSGVRMTLPAAMVLAEEEVRTGLGSPSLSAWGTLPGKLSPMAGANLVTPLGDPDVAQRAWGYGGWVGLRAEARKSVVLLQVGAAAAPSLRPVALPGRDTRQLAHGPFPWTQQPAAPAPEIVPEPFAQPRHPVEGRARLAVGWDDAGGLGAAALSAHASPAGPAVEVGLLCATAPGRPLRATADVGVPLLAPEGAGLRLAAALEWRPLAHSGRSGQH